MRKHLLLCLSLLIGGGLPLLAHAQPIEEIAPDSAIPAMPLDEAVKQLRGPKGSTVVVSIRRDMGKGCFMDLGMSIMAFMLAAEGMGYASCGIGALANHADVAQAHLDLPEDELIVCGMALGRAETDAPVNAVRTLRDAPEDFATFRGFT